MLSDEAACIRNVCEESFAERHSTFIFDQFYSLNCIVEAMLILTLNKGKRKA